MHWYDQLEDILKCDDIYSHKELVDDLRVLEPGFSDSTYHWAVSNLVKEGQIVRIGYDAYARSGCGLKAKNYHPHYSGLALELKNKICEQYPRVSFTVFETVLMNDFLNHLIAQNTIFLQVEKDSSIFLFRFLQEEGYRNLMYKPDRKDFDLYWSRDAIVVTDLISEAPLRTDDPHSITLEKMLVDMIADKLISTTYSKAELPEVVSLMQRQYYLDRIRLLRYARRRNREAELKRYLEGGDKENALT